MFVDNIMSFDLAIIIVNYKTPQLVIDCLESIIDDIDARSNKIIIVDNCSRDASFEEIQNWIDQNNTPIKIELIGADVNTGFSGGNNTGISYAVGANNYLLLNSDTLIRKGAINLLLNAAKSHQFAGLISPRLEWPDATPQESCFRFHTPISELISSARTGLITKLFKPYVVPQKVNNEIVNCDWTSFACVLIKAEVFKAIGLMDDGYFMYYEDVQFCRRATLAGWQVLNQPAAHVVHLRGGSSTLKARAKLRKRLPRYFYESRTRFFYQAYGRTGLLAANLLWTLGASISMLRKLLSSTYVPDIAEKQWLHIWINFTDPLKPYIHPDNYDKS
jgi:N-acetylglucosaminyl-diphospho-decaprenol L-rhamnosyltransferase